MMFTTPLRASHPSVGVRRVAATRERDSRALAADAPGELNVFGHDGDALGVDGAQVGVLEEADQVRSDASCSARMACDWKRRSVLKSCAISRTRRWNGSLRISSSVDFWYFLRTRENKGGERGVERGGTRRQRKTREKETLNLRLRFAQFDVRRDGAIEAPLA